MSYHSGVLRNSSSLQKAINIKSNKIIKQQIKKEKKLTWWFLLEKTSLYHKIKINSFFVNWGFFWFILLNPKFMDNNKLEISKEIQMQCKIEKLSHKLSTLTWSFNSSLISFNWLVFIESQDTLERYFKHLATKIFEHLAGAQLHNWRQKQ